MPHILQNNDLAIYIEMPHEGYRFSRFDWTGKITHVEFQGVTITGSQGNPAEDKGHFGKGFYNEFGIMKAIGFDETKINGWFHKIGVGQLRKKSPQYLFSKKHDIEPAKFSTTCEPKRVLLRCEADEVNGYSYILEKEIELNESSFLINYVLHNTGTKSIHTDEYAHNFVAIGEDPIGEHYILKFPFRMEPNSFNESLNPDLRVGFSSNEVEFDNRLEKEFLFNNLTNGKSVNASWQLINLKYKIGITEIGDFKTEKINLWGNEHVVSPELFYSISLEPGEFKKWSREYRIFRTH